MIRIIGSLFFFSIYFNGIAQQDTLQPTVLDEVILTASRTERKLSNCAVPTYLITQKNIAQSGALRLNDILSEQTGLHISSNLTTTSAGGGVFGIGVQLQGLSPDYILILIDGEPVIGRQGGVIDLSRIAVTNIKKIEIVKGPTSSLYGSEALGGVINIITENAQENKLDASFRYGKFSSADAHLNAAIKKQKWGLQLAGNRNSSDGFDLEKNKLGKSVDPFESHTAQLKLNVSSARKSKIILSGRFYNEKQDNYFQTQELLTNSTTSIVGNGNVNDINLNASLSHQFLNKVNSTLRYYFSRYEYEQILSKESTNANYYYDYFQQNYSKLENQNDIKIFTNNLLSIGGGFIDEKLNTTRYAGERKNKIVYFFLQDEWVLNKKLTIISGLRFDGNKMYQSKWSSKIAVQYRLSNKFRLNASFGEGFKAPDYRQLFLNFLNTAAGGYVVYGANEINIAELNLQKQQGIISEILPRAFQLSLLKPEVSTGLNLGGLIEANSKLSFNFNFFRNDIKNLIQVETIAFRNNAAPVYSYFNVKKAYTQGVEINANVSINKQLQFSAGYQFLQTADKETIKKIKERTVFTRNLLSNETYAVSRNDYAGLPNRSAHMVNAKLFYENQLSGWSGSVRIIYQNKWGTFDKDGNGIINRSDEFAKGFSIVNITVSKTMQSFRFLAGVNNLFNYKDVLNQPGQPGIQPHLSIFYSYKTNKKK